MARGTRFDPLTALVPGAIADVGVRRRPVPAGTRRDRPLGRRGAEVLGGVPLFSGLSRRHLRELAERTDEANFAKGETIVDAGMLGGAFYVILEGEARVSRGSRTLAKLGPGDFFGELALLDGGPRVATVRAATPLTTIRLFKRAFDRLVREEPAVAARMLAVLAKRLRAAEKSITS